MQQNARPKKFTGVPQLAELKRILLSLVRTLSLYRKSKEPARWVPPKDEELIPVEE